MEFPQELDEYIKESIDFSLGLPVSSKTLELKLKASEDALRHLQDQNFSLHARLKEKDELIERSRSEASLNAQALKKFVEENQKLASECSNLLSQCSRWERECSLYDHDREALMEFGNEADERAKDAEIRVLQVENDLSKISEELAFYKHECDLRVVNERKANEELQLLRQRVYELEHIRSLGCSPGKTEVDIPQLQVKAAANAGASALCAAIEQNLLDTVLASSVDKDEAVANAHAFLMANSEVEPFQHLLKMWQSLKPSTQKVIALIAERSTLQTDKEHIRINLTRAEEEVKVLFEENTILDEENKRLLRQCHRERHHQGSGGKLTSSCSSKGNKRKSSPRMSCSIDRIDFGPDSPRQPLSPLQHNSPNSRMHKK